MRLSEAIRLGAMMKPQAFGDYFITPKWRSNGPLGLEATMRTASCALGAAIDAAGFRMPADLDEFSFADVSQEWDEFSDQPSACPECGDVDVLFNLIHHLNDDHMWTREHIADWVQSHELVVGMAETIESESEVTA